MVQALITSKSQRLVRPIECTGVAMYHLLVVLWRRWHFCSLKVRKDAMIIKDCPNTKFERELIGGTPQLS